MNHLLNESLIVSGMASQKIVKTIVIPAKIPNDLSLMDFLRDNNVTIASSCAGVGSCRKCLVNSTLLSCQTSLKLFIEKHPVLLVEISYL